MAVLKIIFWILLFIIFYTYIGYGILLFIIIKLRRFLKIGKKLELDLTYEPEVTLFIAAYNEKNYVAEKMKNSLALEYPKEKLNIVWVTDGSNDGTPDLLKGYHNTKVYHLQERNGKIGAMNRGMAFVKTPIVIFSDANTNLGKESIRRIVTLFGNSKVGCVSGEKRIVDKESDVASGAGEGLYWKYESTLKKWDAELYSVVGAAGELFAIRTDLYRHVEKDTILDDFIISLRVAQDGYVIQYDPEAYAIETASVNVKEELKRKIRISAGGIQSIVRLRALLNIFKYGTLSFQYISHRVLRWSLTPLSLVILIPLLTIIAFNEGVLSFGLYSMLFWLQLLFYASALLGWFLENRQTSIKILFIPYYFFIMNLSVVLGFIRYLKKSQSVNWERSKRAI
ncbi:cellulose synthase/poly-beta-1,6-N-acetylglucosamine synthase-like glycosyltransferase [Flavobacterium sp. PL11]|jgi:cellulose synthase/poly-beta-1,6-N-acetylglucosamine synthase-like glycosyltransferase|nr:cellulose synthase/poly-beta-1,6-N-acetylglucosamine synthase-like glycosyltransferase [Flavobacterium sp. PL11]